MKHRPFFMPKRDHLIGGPLTDWQQQTIDAILADAAIWQEQSFEALRSLVFGSSIPRAWQVWSNGHCPACQNDVRMYDWHVQAVAVPWKLICPHCDQRFPTNDFAAYHRSGLDEEGVFQFALADRSLLYNTEHPDPNDPLHRFGVDDGHGFTDGERCWRFVGAYLIYGQWKQRILAAVVTLADAYAVTGNRQYANRAIVLLHRIADVYPSFSYAEQAVVYEAKSASANGYVSVWHDACEETLELSLAYDRVTDAIDDDNEPLTAFLDSSAEAIHTHIRENILVDALNHPAKVHCNYPRRHVLYCVIRTILNRGDEREQAIAEISEIIHYGTRYDGTSGEKGLPGYASYALLGLASFLSLYADARPELLQQWLRDHPKLAQSWRFHIDTWCLQRYFPSCGDAGSFARPIAQYPSLPLTEGRLGAQTLPRTRLSPSQPHFLYRLYESTLDPAYAQLLYWANEGSVAQLPKSLANVDAAAVQADVAAVIAEHGADLNPGSVNFADWHLALQRSGTGKHRRVLWMSYDSGGMHGHRDALNLGLFSHGLDLLPDFGYPPVGFAGGWRQAKSNWYISTAAHNTVLVDRQDQNIRGWRTNPKSCIPESLPVAEARTSFWVDDEFCHGMRCSVRAYQQCEIYDRLAVMVDIDHIHHYVVDIFRVVGGTEHIKFAHSQFADLTTSQLSFSPAVDDFGEAAQMRNIEWADAPANGWWGEWAIDDRHRAGYGCPLRLRHHDLTLGATAGRCEGWVVWGTGLSPDQEAWIPRLMVKRSAPNGEALTSCFVSVCQPYVNDPQLMTLERQVLADDMDVAIEIRLADGRTDRIVAPHKAGSGVLPDWSPGADTAFRWSRQSN